MMIRRPAARARRNTPPFPSYLDTMDELLRALLATPTGLLLLLFASPTIILTAGAAYWMNSRELSTFRQGQLDMLREIAKCRERLASVEAKVASRREGD